MSTINEIRESRKAPKAKARGPKGKAPAPAPSVTESVKPSAQPDVVATAEKLAKAREKATHAASHYDPTLETAREVGVGSGTVAKAVQSLAQYAAMIGAPQGSHALLIILKGGVTLPPLRKVWDKVASILELESSSSGDYSESDKRKIREFFNATKAANEKFLHSCKVSDSSRIAWRGVKLASGEQKFSATEAYTFKPQGAGETVMTEARLATAKLRLVTAGRLMSQPEKLAASNAVGLFSEWQKTLAKRAKDAKKSFADCKGWPEWVATLSKEDRAAAVEAMAMAPRFAFAEWKRLASLTLPKEGDADDSEE